MEYWLVLWFRKWWLNIDGSLGVISSTGWILSATIIYTKK